MTEDPLAAMPGGRSIPWRDTPEFQEWRTNQGLSAADRVPTIKVPSPEYLAMFRSHKES